MDFIVQQNSSYFLSNFNLLINCLSMVSERISLKLSSLNVCKNPYDSMSRQTMKKKSFSKYFFMLL